MTRYKLWCSTCGDSLVVSNAPDLVDSWRSNGDERHNCPDGEAQTGVTAL